MSKFILFVDSACDINAQLLKEWNVESCELSLTFSDSNREYSDRELDAGEFYNKMREGATPKTSAANMGKFYDAFEPLLSSGNDILYLGFSSGLSATYNFACEAANELKATYTDRKIITVDSLCASAGYGLLVYFAAEMQKNGASIEEVAAFCEETKLKICHWFTVEDLKYLKAGGRISPTTALVGTMLGIKPVMRVDDNGKLVSFTKVRGRRASLEEIAKQYGESAVDKKDGTVFISHGDCLEDANYLAKLLGDTYGATVKVITNVGPVIGSHSGPGTMALFFVGKSR